MLPETAAFTGGEVMLCVALCSLISMMAGFSVGLLARAPKGQP